MNRSAYLRELSARLGRRRVVYFGTRGADARSLTDLMNFDAIFSQIAPSGLGAVEEVCLETVTQRRVDLDSYSVDADRSEAVAQLRAAMLTAFQGSAAVIPYRSCALLASAWFPRSDKVLHLGNFHELQSCFEHKPWVETALSAAGVRVVPWRYFADNERPLIAEMLATRPLVVRSNRSDGGTGVRFIRSPEELATDWPQHEDGFVAVAPFLEGTPINVNGVVFPDGSVSRHGMSVQLVGIPGCTARRFGYCGNDFGAAAAIDRHVIAEADTMIEVVGDWLARHGYRGAFGMDAIVADNGVYLVELNPRFQGSSRLSAALDLDDDRADIFLAHVGAYLGLPVPDAATLGDLAARAPRAHIVVHQRHHGGAWAPTPAPARWVADLLPAPGVRLEPGAIASNLVFHEVVSEDGVTLTQAAAPAIGGWND